MNKIKRTFLLILLCFAGFIIVQAKTVKLPDECRRLLSTEFRSWKFADVPEPIQDYYNRQRDYEQPNLIKGDWNGDGKTDYAVLLEKKDKTNERIILVLMKMRGILRSYILSGSDCIMSVKKGKKRYNFETKKSFRHRHDAIFNYIWEKAGVTYIWEKGKFGVVTTSD